MWKNLDLKTDVRATDIQLGTASIQTKFKVGRLNEIITSEFREKDSGLSSGALPSPEAKEKRGSQKRRQKERPVRQERKQRESSILEADE